MGEVLLVKEGCFETTGRMYVQPLLAEVTALACFVSAWYLDKRDWLSSLGQCP